MVMSTKSSRSIKRRKAAEKGMGGRSQETRSRYLHLVPPRGHYLVKQRQSTAIERDGKAVWQGWSVRGCESKRCALRRRIELSSLRI